MKKLLLLLPLLVACKAELRDLTLVAPAGTAVEYRVGGKSGQVLISDAGRFVIPVNEKVEEVELLVTHPDSARMGAPSLRAWIGSSGGGKYDPVVRKTELGSTRSATAAFFEANCTNLVSPAGADGMVAVSLTPPRSVGDCDDENLRRQDPLWVGRPRGVGEARNYFSESDDRRMGLEFVQQFNAKNGHLLVRDQNVLPYLQNVMDRIVARSDAPHVRPMVHFINADVVNAFALPGGPVYVFRGILDYVRDEHELVGILGHEWAHVAARHGTRNVTRAINGQIAVLTAVIALELYKANSPDRKAYVKRTLIAEAAKLLAYGGTAAVLMSGSRDAEREADQLGGQYAYRVGFNPLGIGQFFQALAGNRSEGFWLDSLFATHPDPLERVANNQSAVDRYFPGDSLSLATNTHEFLQMRSRMRELPGMLRGQEANRVLGLKFVEESQDMSYREINNYFGDFFK